MSTIHEIRVKVENTAKRKLQYCADCDTETIHVRALLIHPFTCVAEHGKKSKCSGCGSIVDAVAKVVVTDDGTVYRFCDTCKEIDFFDDSGKISFSKRPVVLDDHRPLDVKDATSVARHLGATVIGKKD